MLFFLKHHHLENINMQRCRIPRDIMTMILQEISKWQSIKKLTFYKLILDSSHVEIICKIIANNEKTIRNVSIKKSMLNSQELSEIYDEFCKILPKNECNLEISDFIRDKQDVNCMEDFYILDISKNEISNELLKKIESNKNPNFICIYSE